MEEYKVISRTIQSVSYHGSIMFLKTKDGKLYSYSSVPREVFDEFVDTKSHDEFYANRIVPTFSCKRMA